jgi:hypothetical protein
MSQKMAGTHAHISTRNLPNKEQQPHFLDVNEGNNELQTERDQGRKQVLFCVITALFV